MLVARQGERRAASKIATRAVLAACVCSAVFARDVELFTMMSDLAKRGYKFTFSASGGRATMHRPGWFVK